MGRNFIGIKRTTFLINPDGKISYIWKNVKPEGNAREVMSKLEELKGWN